MKFSFSTAVIPELRDWNELAALIAGAGYDGIEWRVQTDYHVHPREILRDAAKVKAVSDEAGLQISCLATYLGWHEIDAIRTVIDAAKAMDCRMVRLGGFVYDPGKGYATLVDDALRQIAAVEPLLGAAGIVGLIETHFGTIHASAHGALKLVDRFDPQTVGIIMDCSNLAVEGREDWRMTIEVLGPYLQHVHVRNTHWSHDDEAGWKWHWTDLAKGQVDWPLVLRTLRQRGYSNYVSSENHWGVLKNNTGYIGETPPRLGGHTRLRTIDERLSDIAFLRAAAGQ